MVHIVTTKFTNVSGEMNGKTRYGVRVYDDAGHATYDNTMFFVLEDIPSDLELLDMLHKCPVNDTMELMLDDISIDGEAIINDQLYDNL